MVKEVFNVTEDSFSVKAPQLIKTLRECMESASFCEVIEERFIASDEATLQDVLMLMIEEGISAFRKSGIEQSKRHFKQIRKLADEEFSKLRLSYEEEL